MERVKSLEDLKNGVARIRGLGKGFVTNFFLDPKRHAFLVEKGLVYCHDAGETFFITIKSDSHSSLFFASTSAEALAADLKAMESECLTVVDLVGRAGQLESLEEAVGANGFRNVCSLVRLSRPTEHQDWIESFDKISFASAEDADEISEMLSTYFDRELEQIPLIEEIREMAANRQILVCRNDVTIAAFVIMEKSASTLYLRYWFVRPEYRDKKIGSLILRRFFHEGNATKRQMLWVIRSNANSVKKYYHYGFREDGLVDDVYIKGDFTPNKNTTNNLGYER